MQQEPVWATRLKCVDELCSRCVDTTAPHMSESHGRQPLRDALCAVLAWAMLWPLNRAGPFQGLYIKPGPGRQTAALCKVLLWVWISVLRLLPRDPPSCTRKKQAVSCFFVFVFLPCRLSPAGGAVLKLAWAGIVNLWTADDDGRLRGAPAHSNAHIILSWENRWLVLQQSMSIGNTIVTRRIF